jgi:hypothetical protein
MAGRLSIQVSGESGQEVATIRDRQFGQANVTNPGADVNTDDRLMLPPRRRSQSRADIIQPPLQEGTNAEASRIDRYRLVALSQQFLEGRGSLGFRRGGP